MKAKEPFRELYARWLRRRFYNRLFLLNAAIFIVVVYLFCIFASFLVYNNERSLQLQHNRETLAAVCDEYDRKHDNFYNIILPLYSSMENYSTLTALLVGTKDTAEINNAYFKQCVVNMMQWLIVQDSDILAILINRKSDGANFIYYENGRSFGPAQQGFPFFDLLKDKPPHGRAIYGVRTWGSGDQIQRAYGIAGYIDTRNINNDAGSIMVAYDVTGLNRVFQQYSVQATGRYLIVSKDGDVIFDSTKALYGKKFDRMDIIPDNGKAEQVDGVKAVVQVIDHSNRSYYGINIVPDATIGNRVSKNTLSIFALGTGISFLSALLYLIAGVVSTRRVKELERAMKNVGSNNLAYRVPLRGTEDEFEHIAIRFNLMCDELQDNINKLYVNKIKQKNAELNALQSGINPHFLYNTLEAIRSKANEDGNRDVAEFIVLMASFLRSLVRSQMFIPIRQEMNFCRMYLDMFALRYADRFEYFIDADPAIMDSGVPKGILQPVLENYFEHGIRKDAFDNRMDIAGRINDGWIVFDITDNGKGIDQARLAEIRSELQAPEVSRATYGLANVHDRIRLVYGEGSGIQIESDSTGGRTVVLVSIRAMTCDELGKSMSIIQKANQQ